MGGSVFRNLLRVLIRRFRERHVETASAIQLDARSGKIQRAAHDAENEDS